MCQKVIPLNETFLLKKHGFGIKQLFDTMCLKVIQIIEIKSSILKKDKSLGKDPTMQLSSIHSKTKFFLTKQITSPLYNTIITSIAIETILDTLFHDQAAILVH